MQEPTLAAAINANRDEMLEQCGRVVLWTGNETESWTQGEWDALGAFCQAHSIDCACVKVADGTIVRLNPVATAAMRQHFMTRFGVGLIPFIYCYGMKFGPAQVTAEAVLIAQYWRAGLPVMQADMEVEYNGQVTAAADFARVLEPIPGLLSVSTWADPIQQDWEQVAHTLAPAVNAWTPQVYSNVLGARVWGQYDPAVFTCIQPGIDLSQEFGANDQRALVQAALAHGAKTFYLWDYHFARLETALVDELVHIIKEAVPMPLPDPSTPSPAPSPSPIPQPEPGPLPPPPTPQPEPGPLPPPPAPTPAPQPAPIEYRVVSGDSLWSIAQHFYGDGALYMTIFQANHTLIRNPDMIQTGWTLTIPPKPEPAEPSAAE